MNCDNLTIYRPTIKDIPEIWQIILQAKAQMKRENRKQWDDEYPSIKIIQTDIISSQAYCMNYNNQIIAYGVIASNREPDYEIIDGKWLTNRDYAVIHRLAIADSAKGKGIATKFMNFAENIVLSNGIKSIKVDTNFDNKYILRIFEKLGYVYCGIIHYDRGDRMAFEKIL